jgi:hypothetical protein
MAGSRFYYYPDSDGELQKVQLGFFASECHPKVFRNVSQVRAGLGSVYNTVHGGGRTVKIMLEFGEGETLVRQMQALEVHLKSGKPCSFAFDDTQTFCAALETEPVRGTSNLDQLTTSFYAYESDALPAAGDVLVVQSPLPEFLSEAVTVATASASRITTNAALKFTYTGSPVIIRHEQFHPYLVLAAGEHDKDLLTSNHGTDWVFNALFIEDTAALHAIEGYAVASSHSGENPTAGSILDLFQGASLGSDTDPASSHSGKSGYFK